MKLKLFYILVLIIPQLLQAQGYIFEQLVHKEAGKKVVLDTIHMPLPASPENTISISFSVHSSIPLLDYPNAVITTNQRHTNLNPGCETNTFDLDFVSGLYFLQPGESGDAVISLSNLPDSSCDLNIQYYISENKVVERGRKVKVETNRFDCPCTMPSYVPRSVWGAAYQLTNDIYRPPATITDVTHLIVHHSATSNTSNNWPGVVASIFNYHANTNQWQDIGYNWLIDPEGNLYQGRGGGDDVRGAHMCGYNDNTLGICMLGTFTNVDPDPRALATLDSLLAYKSCQKNFDPTTSAAIVSYPGTMFRVSGHRDGCAPNYTECPGNRLHAFLPAIRQNTFDFIQGNCSPTGIDQSVSDKQFKLYNNGQNLRLVSKLRGECTIISASGNEVWSTTFLSGENEWRLSIPAGIYFAKISIGEAVSLEKVIIPID